MTEPRINLARLRRKATPDGKSGAATVVECAELLALVEAVEAARAVLDYENTPSRASLSALRAALLPFTEETTGTLSAPSAREPLAPPKSTPAGS